MRRFKSVRAGFDELFTIMSVSQGLYWVLGIAGFSTVIAAITAKLGAPPLEAALYALLFALVLALLFLAYRVLMLNVSMEFKPSEHPSYFYEWGVVSEDDSMSAAYAGEAIVQYQLIRLRLRVYGGNTVENVKVVLDSIEDCDELRGMCPLPLHFTHDDTVPAQSSLALNRGDDQFIDVASLKSDTTGPTKQSIIFHGTINKPIEVPLRPYVLTLKLTGKGIASESRRFWIGIAETDDAALGMQMGRFAMKPLP